MAARPDDLQLMDYDAQLLELAHQLDSERREIIIKFAQDLLLIGQERELDLCELVIINETRH